MSRENEKTTNTSLYGDSHLIPSSDFIDSVRMGRGDFRKIGDNFVNRYIANGWVNSDTIFLDIGCGLGRIARPLLNVLGDKGKYIGYDINKTSIDWCKKSYSDYKSFSFNWVDVRSKVYNPDGKDSANSFNFPLPDESVDFVHMSSVFTHMFPADIRAYLKEISRMLVKGGRCSITFFLLDPLTKHLKPMLSSETLENNLLGVKDWYPIDGGYLRNKELPEDVVIVDELLVREMYGESGLIITNTIYGGWCAETRGQHFPPGDGQDIIDAIKS